MRLAVFVLLSVTAASAQFYQLTTTGDGNQVLFATTLRTQGSDLPFHGKIYLVGSDGLALFAFRPEVPPEPFPPGERGTRTTNYFELSAPEVSDDGSVVIFTGLRQCYGTAACSSVERLETTVLRGGEELHLRGANRLSRNGRYAFGGNTGSLVYMPPTITDLSTGAQRSYAPVATWLDFNETGRVVADDGTAVFGVSSQDVYIVRSDGVQRLLSAWGDRDSDLSTAEHPVIDAAARYVIYEARPRDSSFRQLRLIDLADNSRLVLVTGPGDVFGPSISADGQRVSFISDAQFGTPNPPGLPQLYVVNIDGTGFRQVSFDPDGVLRATLSSDGKVAWYVSGAGRLFRLDLESGRTEQRIGRTLTMTLSGFLTPGSAGGLTGAGFHPNTRVLLNGVPVPMLSVASSGVLFQTPWEAQSGQQLEVQSANEPPFESVRTAEAGLAAFYPVFVAGAPRYDGYTNTLAAHEDWSSLVTEQNPVRPGEIVYLYATGLGPVTPPVATGQPGPSSPPARMVQPFSCVTYTMDSRAVDMPVYYAGLAPLFIGYYQVSLRVPNEEFRDWLSFRCQGAQPDPYGYGWLPVFR